MVRLRALILSTILFLFITASVSMTSGCAAAGGGESTAWNSFSVLFDGATGFASASTFRDLFQLGAAGHLTGFTVSFWIKYAAFPAGQVAILGASSTAGWENGFVFWHGNNTNDGSEGPAFANRLRFGPDDWNDNEVGILESSLSLNTWYHVVGVYDEAAVLSAPTCPTDCGVIMYVNGALAEQVTGRNFDPGGSNFREPDAGFGTLEFGRNVANNGAVQLDEIAIWKDILSAAEVAALYNSGTPFRPTGESGAYDSSGDLVGYWDMGDGDTFPTLTDRSGNGNDATIQNMTSSSVQEDSPGGS